MDKIFDAGTRGRRLHPYDLRAAADALDKLAEVGVRVSSFQVGDVTYHLEAHDDQREGRSYAVTRIDAP